MSDSEIKVGSIVRDSSGGETLFEVVALPVARNPKNPDQEPGDPRLTVRYVGNPSQVRHVEAKRYVVATADEIAELGKLPQNVAAGAAKPRGSK